MVLNNKNMDVFNNWRLILLLCLTLGLAPYFPEPHVYGKIKWILGVAHGMAPMDWLDAFLHSLPFLFLIRLIVVKGIIKKKNS